MTRKTIGHYLSDLCIDLKVTLETELTTTQLTRCVEKAVADFSRFVPREMSKEITVDAEVTGESFTTPAVANAQYVVNAVTLLGETSGATMTIAAQRLDVPRPLVLTVVDANSSINQLIVIVKGVDADNKYAEEFFYLEGGLVQTGKQYFSYITQVELDTVAGNGAGDTLSIGTGDADGVYVQLANKPIKFQSETVTGTYALDTDYEMDYYGGRIAMKDGGSMVVSTAYTIAYTKSRIDIDLSTFIDDIIKVERVEYPVGNVPQQFSNVEVWGNTLTLTGGHESQAEVSDAEHMVIKYLAPHSPPNAQSPGSYPSSIDTTIELAASAYALFILAQEYEQAAATDLLEVKTTLGYLGIGGVGAAALTLVYKLIDDALDKVATYLEPIGTQDNAADALSEIKDMEAYLRDMIIKLSDGTGAIATANSMLDLIATLSIDKASTGAEALLDTGDDYIDAINNGMRVPENYKEYAQARSEIALARTQTAMGYFQEVQARLEFLRSYVEESGAWTRIGETFIAEAQTRLGEAQVYLAEAVQYQEVVSNNMLLADRFRAEAIERRNEAWAIWASPNQIAPMYTLGQRGQTQ